MDIILDACSIINLINGGLLQKVVTLASIQFHVGEILLEDEILNEVQKIKVNTLVVEGNISVLEASVSLSEFTRIKGRYNLGKGEVECIALCKRLQYSISSDDLKARNSAINELGKHAVKGTLFLIRELVRDGAISCEEAMTAYRSMIVKGAFLPTVDEHYFCE